MGFSILDKSTMGVLKEVALNLHVSMSDHDMLLSNLTICEHMMSSHLIMSSLVSEMFYSYTNDFFCFDS